MGNQLKVMPVINIDRRIFLHIDWVLLGLSFLIPALGLIVLYSAGFDPDSESVLSTWLPFIFQSPTCAKQAAFLVIGFFVMIVGLSIPTQVFHRYAYLVYFLGVLLLACVATFGTIVNGSRRWLDFGGLNLQPSELMKMGIIFSLARTLSRAPPRNHSGYSLSELLTPLLLLALPMFFIIKQPDLGTGLSLCLVGLSMILFVGIRPKTLLIVTGIFLSLLYPSWHMLHDYQQRRILVLLNPEIDPSGSGYHINQSKIAVGSGELFGKGFLQGTQSQLEFLPEHTTDFIFSVLAEEWGFFGSIAVLTCYFLLLLTMLKIAYKSKDLFSCLLVIGITSQIFIHVVINTGMVMGILPVVGIPLPLFSYGGSALVSLMFGLGVVQGVSMRRSIFSKGR